MDFINLDKNLSSQNGLPIISYSAALLKTLKLIEHKNFIQVIFLTSFSVEHEKQLPNY